MKTVLKINNITKVYNNGHIANDNISLDIKEGQFFGLLGVNGAGKSTLLNIISNLTIPTSGNVEIYGVNLAKNPILAKQYLGVVPQEVNLNQFETISNTLDDFTGLYGITNKSTKEYADYIIENLTLTDHKDKPVASLSGGMKRRALIARALITRPKILLLDEPTAGVDVEIRHSLWEFIKTINKQGTTVILTTHYLEEAEKMCEQIAIIHKGKLLRNGPTSSLLGEINYESITIKADDITKIDSITLPSQIKIIEKNITTNELTLSIPANFDYTEIFKILVASNLVIRDFRHLENRLESVFLNLIKT